MEERLQKIIARAGIASRREAEDLISAGLVTVNGEVVTQLGSKADPDQDHIKVKGKLLRLQQNFTYVLLHKPKGVVSTVNDPEDRPVVTDLVKGVKARIYPVGRLDINTEGALLLTNDGSLTNQLLAPRTKCPKTYLVKVSGIPAETVLKRLERGITVDGTRYGTCEIEILKAEVNTWLKVVLLEGKNHQIKNMFQAVGHPVSKLRRVAFAFLTIKGLAPGEWRVLTPEEINLLKRGALNPEPPLAMRAFLKDYGISFPRERRKPAPFSGRPSDKPYRKTSGKPHAPRSGGLKSGSRFTKSSRPGTRNRPGPAGQSRAEGPARDRSAKKSSPPAKKAGRPNRTGRSGPKPTGKPASAVSKRRDGGKSSHSNKKGKGRG